jgi:hypothetical protein
VGLSVESQEITWIDFGKYHCYEGFFRDSLQMHQAVAALKPVAFISAMAALAQVAATVDCINPSALIFHAGRCGSTLLARVLARSRQHLLLSEAAPHNQFWRLTFSRGVARAFYRNLVRTMGRRRLTSHSAHIIKYTSFNIMQYSFIRSVFPNVPALFLYREPGAILASYHRGQPQWIGARLGGDMGWDTPEAAVEQFFKAALSIRDPLFRSLDYADLSVGSLAAILGHFRLKASPAVLRQMEREFQWNAKSGPTPQPFKPRNDAPHACPEILHLQYERLRSHHQLLNS